MIMRNTVTPPIDDEMDGDYWSRMNPRDDRVPLGCHLNLDDDDDDEEEDDDHADLGLPLELEDEDDDADDDVGSQTERSPSSSPLTERQRRPLAGSTSLWAHKLTQLVAPHQPAVPVASEPIPIASCAGVKRTLSEDQLRASNKLAEYRDFIMFQRLVNGISRQQQEAVWENPRVVNDECLASIIGAHNLTDHDLMDLDANPRIVAAAASSLRRSPPTLLLPPPVGAVVPMPVAIRPAADPNHSMAMGAHLGPKIIPTVIRPLTLVSVLEKSTRSPTNSSSAHPSSAFSSSAKASPSRGHDRRASSSLSTMEDAIFDLDL